MEWVKTIGNGICTADLVLLCVAVLLVVLLCIRHGRPALKKLTARDDIPGYALLYADRKQDKNEDFGRLLYSAKYDLQGRPDYVFCSRLLGRIVPVELKSGCIGEAEEPHHGDFLQLAAYFLILEDVYGKRPAYGRLVYRDYMFEIKNTARVRREVLKAVQEMRQMLRDGIAEPKPSFAHCRPCVCNGTVCQFSETEIEGVNDDSCREE